MPKGKKKNKQHKPRKPPLSPLNKFLYILLITLTVASIFGILFGFMMAQQKLGEASGAIAVKAKASMALMLIPMFPMMVAIAVIVSVGYENKVPLVGRNAGTLPGERPPSKKARRKKLLAMGLVVLLWLSSFVLVVGAVYNRVEITPTHIDTYAMFGRLSERRPLEDATAVHVRILSDGWRMSYTGWRMSYTIYFADGEKFYFEKSPSIMIRIDELFPGVPKTVEGVEDFDRLCKEYDCTPEERARLEELFMIKKSND